MYCEDVDLGWRLQARGWPCIYAPDAIVYHHLSATGGGSLASYYVSRNVWLILTRSVPRGVMSPFKFRITAYHVGRIVRMIRACREPAARASLRGTIAGLVQAVQFLVSESDTPDADALRLRALLHDTISPFHGT
jgi:GT2 family glycosyltransferase